MYPVILTFMQRNIRIQVPKYVGELLLGHDGEFQHRIVISLSKEVRVKMHSDLPQLKADDININPGGCIKSRTDLK